MAQNLACEVLGELAVLVDCAKTALQLRATSEKPKRVSVIDVIVIVTGAADAHVAAQILRRMLETYAELKEKIDQFKFPGQGQRETPVTDVRGMVEIIQVLPGPQAGRLRRQAAEILVRYLGGDLTLIDEVCALRNYQEHVAEEEPEGLCRLFGEAVETTLESAHTERSRKQFLGDVRAVVRDEMQKTHVWSFSKRSRHHQELERAGVKIQGGELLELDEREHVVRVIDFLQDRIKPSTWKLHGRKFKNIFTVELKQAKLCECRDEGKSPPITFDQGEYRIVYTDADYDLMVQVYVMCSERFANIAGRDDLCIAEARRGQRSIVDFMQERAEGAEGQPDTRNIRKSDGDDSVSAAARDA